jgi:hypothetical protein
VKTAVNRITIALSATAFFISAGCGISSLGKDSNAQPIVSQDLHLAAGAPLQSFQTGFYAFALKNCAQCHSSDQTPLFAVSSVTAAYSNAISYLNVSNPEKSEFISQATNGHCGVVGCSNPANAPTVANDMSKWATAINDANNPTTGGPTPVVCTNGTIAASTNITYFSVPIPIPSNIPGIGDSGTIMRWYLSNPNLIPADSSVSYRRSSFQKQTPRSFFQGFTF